MNAVDLACAHEGRRPPRVYPFPFDRLGDIRPPESPKVLEAPVREVAREIGDHLDPLRVRVLDRRLGHGRTNHQNVRLAGLDRAKVSHLCRIAAA